MTNRNRTDGLSGGRRRQSAVPQRKGFRDHVLRAHGLNVRAAVLTTYVQLDGTAALPDDTFQNVTAVYCDVLVYTSIEGYRGGPLARVPVMQHLGMHSGHIWVPKPTTVDVVESSLKSATVDPMDVDGDHVRIEFLEDDLSRPIITGRIPHPRLGQGNEELVEVGHRMKLKTADGLVEFWKHNGTFFGVDKDGNFVVNTSRAHSGETSATGAEVPKDDASHGHVNVVLSDKTKLTVVDASGNNLLELDTASGSVVAKFGTGAKHVAIVEALEDFYNTTIKPWLAAITVGTGVGPSTPPLNNPPPPWSSAINSTKIKIPDG